MYRFRSGEMA